METGDWIAVAAVVMAFLALIISALSYSETRRTANANEKMAAANETMARANEQMVKLTQKLEQSAVASAEAARASYEHDLAQSRAANAAHFAYSRGKQKGTGEYEGTLTNRGPAIAHDVSAAILHEDTRIGGQRRYERIEPGKALFVHYKVPSRFMASQDDRILTVRLDYTDGNGAHQKEWTIRLVGAGTVDSWDTEILTEPEYGRPGLMQW